jgi:hypothetical protein
MKKPEPWATPPLRGRWNSKGLPAEAPLRELLEELAERAVRRQVGHRELLRPIVLLVVTLDIRRGLHPELGLDAHNRRITFSTRSPKPSAGARVIAVWATAEVE